MCKHTEHALRAGVGVVGRHFENDTVNGEWEPCTEGDGPDVLDVSLAMFGPWG